MLNSGRIVRLTRTQSIRCYECGEERGVLVIYDLVASFKAEKRKVNVDDAWFRVSPLSLSLSLSLSLLELEFWSVGVVCFLLILLRCREICFFIAFLSSVRIKLGFLCFFYREGHGLAEKLLLIIFIF